MWVRRTEEERAEQQRQRHRDRKIGAVLLGFFVLVFTALVSDGLEAYRRGSFEFPAPDTLSRLPVAIVAGVMCGFLGYKFRSGRKRPTAICPQCESVKDEDGVGECGCGGRFEDLEKMKFVIPSGPPDDAPPSS